jgi:hypothetical protein
MIYKGGILMKKNDVLIYSFLAIIIVFSVFTGLFVDWTEFLLAPVLVIGIGTTLIRVVSLKLTHTGKMQNYIFTLISVFNFMVYVAIAFIPFKGDVSALVITYPLIILFSLTYTVIINRLKNNTIILLSNILIIGIFIFSVHLAAVVTIVSAIDI